MPQIILKERTAHLASYTFFTRDADQYKNASFSQLYQPPRTFISQNTYHQLLSSCENTSRSSRLQMFFKIGVVKSFANFTGKHLCWSLFLKNLQGESLKLHKKDFNTGVFLRSLRNFFTEHLLLLLLILRWLLLYFFKKSTIKQPFCNLVMMY